MTHVFVNIFRELFQSACALHGKVPPVLINSLRLERSVRGLYGGTKTQTHFKLDAFTPSAVFLALNACKMRETEQPFSIRIIIFEWIEQMK